MMFCDEIVMLSLLNAIGAFDNVLSGHTIMLGSFGYLRVKNLTANKDGGERTPVTSPCRNGTYTS